MLGKLLKHEWKGIYKVGCLFLVALLGVSFLGWLAFQSPMWRSLAEDTVYQSGVLSLLDVASVFTLFLYALMLVAASVGIMVYLAIHFYKTMYTDEGYLTHTLPVTKNKLLFQNFYQRYLGNDCYGSSIVFAVWIDELPDRSSAA